MTRFLPKIRQACPGCIGFVVLPVVVSQRLCDEGGHETVAGAGPDKDGTGTSSGGCPVPAVWRRAPV